MKLTNGSLIARNTIFNIIGVCTPLFVAIWVIPYLIKGLGPDRFGILTLVWIVIGYYTFFDLGLSRTLTKFIAEKLSMGQEKEIPGLISTAMFLMLLLGMGGTFVITASSPWLIQNTLKIPKELRLETLSAFYLIGVSLPVVISTAGLIGVLEAQQRFDLINIVRIPMGIFNLLGPLLVISFTKNLTIVVTILVIIRFIGWSAYLILCLRVTSGLRWKFRMHKTYVKPLIHFGSWVTVSNIISPLILALDRFLIGALISIEAVAYYTAPYDIVMKLLVIPGAFAGVFFPAFSTSIVQDREHINILFCQSIKYIFLLLFPLTLFLVTLAPEIIHLWLGSQFAENSSRVLQWLTIGILMNGLAYIPFSFLQGSGRPDQTGKLHLLELPFYLLTVFWLIRILGIEGAAIAWVARVAFDAIILFLISWKLLHVSTSIKRRMFLTMGVAIGIFAVGLFQTNLVIKIIFLLLTLLTFILISWFVILLHDERMYIRNGMKSLFLKFRKENGVKF